MRTATAAAGRHAPRAAFSLLYITSSAAIFLAANGSGRSAREIVARTVITHPVGHAARLPPRALAKQIDDPSDVERLVNDGVDAIGDVGRQAMKSVGIECGGEDDDRVRLRKGRVRGDEIDAVHPRHHEVDEDHAVARLTNFIERFDSVRSGVDKKGFALQRVDDEGTNGLVI